METKKSKIGCLLKGLVFFIIIIGILFLSAFIFYRITREDVKKYIPDDYFGYVKIDSITSAYNNLIDL
ncbi:MAG: hypothetical protein KAT05_18335, partial [Spirochaetes bacterium]|nr:hypothetical protein [Spirochaetota bacterium]